VFGLIHAKFSDFFQCNNSASTRGHAYKLYKSQYTNSARTNFFANRIVNVWNSLLATVDFNSLAAFNRTVKRADLSAFLSYNCTRCFYVFYIVHSCHVSSCIPYYCSHEHLSVQEYSP